MITIPQDEIDAAIEKARDGASAFSNYQFAETKTYEQPYLDKKGFAARWGMSARWMDRQLTLGLPHMKLGHRTIRIVVAEADEWLKGRYSTARLGRMRPK